MTAERPAVAAAAVRTRAPVGAAPPGTQTTGPDAPGGGRNDSDPSHPVLSCSASFGSVPRPDPAAVPALIRAQLRTALGTGAVVLTVLAGLPALLALVPELARTRVHGLPLPGLVLAFGVQPVWIAVALRQLRRAERAERELPRR